MAFERDAVGACLRRLADATRGLESLARAVSARVDRGAALLGLLAVVAFAVEWQGIRHAGFVYEDAAWQAAAERAFVWHPSARPLAALPWRLLAGWAPIWPHLLSVAIHGLNAILVGGLVWRLGLSAWSSTFAGAVFLLHPFQVEAAAYLAARADLLGACGVLLALHAWRSDRVGRGFLFLTCAVLCKETAILGLALWPLVRGRWGLSIATLIGLLVTVGLWSAIKLHAPPTPGWAIVQLTAGAHLVMQMLLPTQLTVDFDYASLSLAVVERSVVAVLCLGAVAWVLRRDCPRWAMGALWIVSVIALRVMVVTPLSPLNEHQLYLGMVGFALLAGSVSEWVWRQG